MQEDATPCNILAISNHENDDTIEKTVKFKISCTGGIP